MLRTLQISVLTLLTCVVALGLPTLWIASAPEMPFRSFISQYDVLSPFVAIAAAWGAAVAFLLGWNPAHRSLGRIRSFLVERLLLSARAMTCVIALCLTAIALLFAAGLTIMRGNHEILSFVLQENYDAADVELAALKAPPDEFADLFVIVNAMRQLTRNASRSADATECRIYANYLDGRPTFLLPMWRRYLVRTAKAACLQVLDNPALAAAELERARALASWVSDHEVRRTARAIAQIHLRDKSSTSGAKERETRLRYVIQLVSADAHPTATRMLGSARYELGEYSEAIAIWQRLLDGERNVIEQKRLKNSIALGYVNMLQHTSAAKVAQSGLELVFSESVEDERREQVRLLATASIISTARGRCTEAASFWDQRKSLMRQQDSKCSLLVQAQVESCGTVSAPQRSARTQRVVNSLIRGIGQDPDAFTDRSNPSRLALLKQARMTFQTCYVGLAFDEGAMARAMEITLPEAVASSQ